MIKPILECNTHKKEGKDTYMVQGFVFDEPIKKANTVQMHTKFELGLNGKLVNTLFSPSIHNKESLEKSCNEMLDVKSLFE